MQFCSTFWPLSCVWLGCVKIASEFSHITEKFKLYEVGARPQTAINLLNTSIPNNRLSPSK
jgi:hypothetical protein